MPQILYADADILVVVKPVGLLSEEAPEGSLPTLLATDYGRLYPVHRLDRVVGGVMVYARNGKSAAALSRAVSENRLIKRYIAVLEGKPERDADTLSDLLFKDARQGKSFVVKTPRKGARAAELSYTVTGAAVYGEKPLTRVAVTLKTGRSHQIRVQFSSRGTPLVGDGKYGARVKAASPALFAVCLTLPHPKDGRELTFAAKPQGFPFDLFAPTETERKYLIKMPDVSALARLPDCRILSMEQTYLSAEQGETHRVRLVREGASVTYIETTKVRVNALSAVEREKEISAARYGELLALADPTRHTVIKTRYRVPVGAREAEIDVYPFWQDRAVLEIELADERETVFLPDFVTVLREVTTDFRYKNVNLAKSVPNDEIFQS
ncbi:MAG: hypothetical protein IJC99_04055 [Clostridia bacterium]|nr:hypothetical protein [Clostridia bacterium]